MKHSPSYYPEITIIFILVYFFLVLYDTHMLHKTQLLYPFYVDGYLGGLQFLAYSVAMNLLVRVFCECVFLYGVLLGVELVSHRVCD